MMAEAITNVIIKLSRNNKQLLIMSKDVAKRRSNKTRGCWSFFTRNKSNVKEAKLGGK